MLNTLLLSLYQEAFTNFMDRYKECDMLPLFAYYSDCFQHIETDFMAKKKYTFIDLFAGCGGLSEGILSTGRYEALAHIEWEKPMVDTLRNRLVERWNHPEVEDGTPLYLYFVEVDSCIHE